MVREIVLSGLELVANAKGTDLEAEADQLLAAVNGVLARHMSESSPQLGRYELLTEYREIVDLEGDNEPTRKAFKVAAVSSNRNSFGLRSMVVVAPDGKAYRVLSNDVNIKREGNVIQVEQRDGGWNFAALGYEVPEKLPNAPSDVVKAVWKPREEEDCAEKQDTRPADHPARGAPPSVA
jgi:hypothetical protein